MTLPEGDQAGKRGFAIRYRHSRGYPASCSLLPRSRMALTSLDLLSGMGTPSVIIEMEQRHLEVLGFELAVD